MQQAVCAPITGQRDCASGNFDTLTRRAMLGAGAAVLAYGGSRIVGPSAQADPALLAWADYKRAYDAYEAAPYDDDDAEDMALLAAEDRLVNVRPSSAAGVAAVLRYGFLQQIAPAWAANIAHDRATASDWEDLRLSDLQDRLLWRMIETLEGLA